MLYMIVGICFMHNCICCILTAEFSFVAQRGPFHATQLWTEMVEVLRQEVSMKRRRIGRHRGQEESFSGADAVDVVLKFLRERRDQFSAVHDSSRRDKAIKVVLVVCSSLCH